MLDVAYEAVVDLPPGRLAEINEDRGWIRVRVDKHEKLADVVRQLNIEIDRLMSSARWFQLWDTEIVSRDSPGRPLSVTYILCPQVPREMGVGVGESRGAVRVYICPELDVEAFAAAMNPAVQGFLEAGHWFQLYGGEIIDNSPEPMNQV
jgi:hypothetical protein